jgi:hypothetical protein
MGGGRWGNIQTVVFDIECDGAVADRKCCDKGQMADMDAVTGKLCHFPPIKVQQWQ